MKLIFRDLQIMLVSLVATGALAQDTQLRPSAITSYEGSTFCDMAAENEASFLRYKGIDASKGERSDRHWALPQTQVMSGSVDIIASAYIDQGCDGFPTLVRRDTGMGDRILGSHNSSKRVAFNEVIETSKFSVGATCQKPHIAAYRWVEVGLRHLNVTELLSGLHDQVVHKQDSALPFGFLPRRGHISDAKLEVAASRITGSHSLALTAARTNAHLALL
ncbi:MAG: hypothetical protein ABJL99_21670 [Aliishimia sp.]